MDQTLTHFTEADRIPDRRGSVRAVCGRLVNEKQGETDVQAPTCQVCQQWLQRRDEEPLPSWATEITNG